MKKFTVLFMVSLLVVSLFAINMVVAKDGDSGGSSGSGGGSSGGSSGGDSGGSSSGGSSDSGSDGGSSDSNGDSDSGSSSDSSSDSDSNDDSESSSDSSDSDSSGSSSNNLVGDASSSGSSSSDDKEEDETSDVKEEIKKAEEKITESSKDGKEVSASEKLLAESKTKLTEAEATDDSTLKEKLLEEAEDLAKEARMKFIGKSIDDIEEKSDERTTIIDDQGREVEVRTKTKTKGDRTETEERQTFVDENGNKIEIRTKTVMKDGKEEVVVKRKVESPDGTEITLKTKTEVREGRERVTNTIEVKGVEVTTELSVREENRADRAIVKAKLSTGAEQDIIVLPDEVILTAFEELQATDNFVFELNEVVDGDTRKAAFSAKASKPGKLLGVFNTQVDLETLIDTVTGEIIKTERPWWAFLVVEADDAVVCHVIGANKVKTLDVAIPAVKSHLEHGDNVGKCSAFCGDSILVEGVESCEVDDTQACTTAEGYSGTATCDLTCTGFDTCVSAEFCGDSVVNGNEACDDGDVIAGDGCDASCQIEVPVGSSTVA